MSSDNIGEVKTRPIQAEQLVEIINDTYGLTSAYERAVSLKESLEIMVLRAQHLVIAPEGFLFELRHVQPRYPVKTGRCYGDESQQSGIHLALQTLMEVGPETEPFYADKLAVIRGSGRVAVDRLYNFRAFDTEAGDRVELVEASATQE